MGLDPRARPDTVGGTPADQATWQRVGDRIVPGSRKSSFSQGASGDTCTDCGRDEGHRWHSPGYAMMGDGMVHHKFNPNSEPFERLTPTKGE